MTLIPHNALIVVADGGGALLLRNAGKPGRVMLRQERKIEPDPFDNGPAGVRPNEQTLSEIEEATFAKQLTNILNKMKLEGAFDQLVLVADPQTLGQIRPFLHKTVEASLLRSLAKDLTNHTLDDIAAAIAA